MKHFSNKIISLLTAALILTLPLVGCGANIENYKTFSYSALDTVTTIKISQNGESGKSLSDEYITSVSEGCADILSDLDLALSDHNENSEVYALNSNVNILISENEALFSILETAYTISKLTDGAYDCTAGALTELWNFEGHGPVPSNEEIAEALTHVGMEKFEISDKTIKKLDENAKINFDVIEKGVAAQQILEYISQTDVSCGVVAVGNTVGVFGAKSKHDTFKLGIKDPDGALLGYMYIASGFVATAGDRDLFYEEGENKYHNIINPKTGIPADNGLREVVVYTANGASAAALSNALFVLGTEKSLSLYEDGSLNFEAIFVTDSGEIITTPGITEKIFEPQSKVYKLSATDEKNK